MYVHSMFRMVKNSRRIVLLNLLSYILCSQKLGSDLSPWALEDSYCGWSSGFLFFIIIISEINHLILPSTKTFLLSTLQGAPRQGFSNNCGVFVLMVRKWLFSILWICHIGATGVVFLLFSKINGVFIFINININHFS